jgi:chromosomal replication initiator protein
LDPNWAKCLEKLKGKVSEQVFSEVLQGLNLTEMHDNRGIILVPQGRDLKGLRPYKGLVELAWQEATGRTVEFDFRVESPVPVPSRMGLGFGRTPSVSLSDQFSFENFVVGDKSQFAYSAAFAVAQNPGSTKYNPLLIFGGSGLGKTHLIQAIGNYILEGDTGKRVRYLTADDFQREYVDSLKNGVTNEMSNYYRSEVDVLLIDDVQFLSGKIETQNEFFHIFNSLHQASKQIVLTSDVPPSEIKDLSERLVSRFSWGLSVDIKPPDAETREAILRKKAEASQLELEDEVLQYLAISIEGSVRLLEGAVRKLLFVASSRNKDIDMAMAREVVAEIAPTFKRRVGIESIINAVAKFYEVSEDKLLEAGRGTKEVAHARQVAMYLMKLLTAFSLKSVGTRFGNRDHSTVVHACKTIEKEMADDPSFARVIENLKNSIHD